MLQKACVHIIFFSYIAVWIHLPLVLPCICLSLMLTCKACGRTRYWVFLRYGLQIYVEGLWKCVINLTITNVMDEIRVRKLQNVLQENDILSRDAHVERNNVRRWLLIPDELLVTERICDRCLLTVCAQFCNEMYALHTYIHTYSFTEPYSFVRNVMCFRFWVVKCAVYCISTLI